MGVGEEVRRDLASRRGGKIEELEPFARFTFQPECLGIDTEPIVRVRWGEDATFHLAKVPYVEAVDGAEGSERLAGSDSPLLQELAKCLCGHACSFPRT